MFTACSPSVAQSQSHWQTAAQPLTPVCNYASGHATHSLSLIKRWQSVPVFFSAESGILYIKIFFSPILQNDLRGKVSIYIWVTVALCKLVASANPPRCIRQCQHGNDPRSISVCSKNWITDSRRLSIQQLQQAHEQSYHNASHCGAIVCVLLY